jgi:hypothetical protein
MKAHQALFLSFLASEEAAQLDGYRNLTSSVWRSRFGNLRNLLQTNRELADQSYAAYDPSLAGVSRVNEAAIRLEQTTDALGAVAGRYINGYIPDEPWDEAWTNHYRAQDSLESAVAALSPETVARADCKRTIN